MSHSIQTSKSINSRTNSIMPKIFKTLDDIRPVNTNGTDKLGQGTFSKVNLVCHKANPSKFYAMKKVVLKNEKDRKLVYQEINLHMSLDHPNVIRFEDYIELPDRVYIFLEYAQNGDMFKFITKFKPNDQTLMKLYHQTCIAIKYIHSRNIMHRDLKPENILLDADLNVKLCDFGWSAEYLENVNRETLCGTYEYMAPEIFFRNKQTKKTDIWALGVLLYEMYHGHAPFRGTRMDTVMNAIMKKVVSFKKSLPPGIKDLIMKILVFEPKDRPTVEDILNHSSIVEYVEIRKAIDAEKALAEKEAKPVEPELNVVKKKQLVHSNSMTPTCFENADSVPKPKSFLKQSMFLQSYANSTQPATKLSSPKQTPKGDIKKIIFSATTTMKKTQTEDLTNFAPFTVISNSTVVNQSSPKKTYFDKVSLNKEPLTRTVYSPKNRSSHFRHNSNALGVKVISQRIVNREEDAKVEVSGFNSYFKPDFVDANHKSLCVKENFEIERRTGDSLGIGQR